MAERARRIEMKHGGAGGVPLLSKKQVRRTDSVVAACPGSPPRCVERRTCLIRFRRPRICGWHSLNPPAGGGVRPKTSSLVSRRAGRSAIFRRSSARRTVTATPRRTVTGTTASALQRLATGRASCSARIRERFPLSERAAKSRPPSRVTLVARTNEAQVGRVWCLPSVPTGVWHLRTSTRQRSSNPRGSLAEQ